MKNLLNWAAIIITLSTIVYAMWTFIPSIKFKFYAYTLLLIALISFAFNDWYMRSEDQLADTVRTPYRVTVYLPRLIPIFMIIALILIPNSYQHFPIWLENETVKTLQNQPDNEIIDLNVEFNGKKPDKNSNLFLFLRDTSATKIHNNENVEKASEASLLIKRLIGKPDDLLHTFFLLTLIISIIILIIIPLLTHIGIHFNKLKLQITPTGTDGQNESDG